MRHSNYFLPSAFGPVLEQLSSRFPETALITEVYIANQEMGLTEKTASFLAGVAYDIFDISLRYGLKKMPETIIQISIEASEEGIFLSCFDPSVPLSQRVLTQELGHPKSCISDGPQFDYHTQDVATAILDSQSKTFRLVKRFGKMIKNEVGLGVILKNSFGCTFGFSHAFLEDVNNGVRW